MNRECLITWWHAISSMRCVSHQRAKTLLTRACSPLAPKNDCWHISKFNLLCDHRGRRLQARRRASFHRCRSRPSLQSRPIICQIHSFAVRPLLRPWRSVTVAVVGREVFHFDRATFEIEMGSRVISSVDTDHSPLDARLYLSVEVK